MTKKELIDAVAEATGATKASTKEAIDAALEAITNKLAEGETVDLAGFGKFTVKERAAHAGINPATKEKIEVAASKSVGFKAAKALKDSVQ